MKNNNKNKLYNATHNDNEEREKAWRLWIQGKTQTEIAKEIGVDQSTISRWLLELHNEGKKRLEDLTKEGAGYLLHQTFEGLNVVISTAWQLYEAKQDHRILHLLGNLYLQRGRFLADMDLVSMRRNASNFVWENLSTDEKIKRRIEQKQDDDKLFLGSL